jgi:hypothetical protein
MATKLVNGKRVELTPEQKEALEIESKRLTEKDAERQWFYDRQLNYPPLVAQLDKIFHEGLDAWRKDIQAVKDQFPKPE